MNFYAPIDEKNPDNQINYDFRSLGVEAELIRTGQDERYCLQVAYKVAFYVSRLYQREILRMRCQFAKDVHGTIWFQYADDIWIRPDL